MYLELILVAGTRGRRAGSGTDSSRGDSASSQDQAGVMRRRFALSKRWTLMQNIHQLGLELCRKPLDISEETHLIAINTSCTSDIRKMFLICNKKIKVFFIFCLYFSWKH